MKTTVCLVVYCIFTVIIPNVHTQSQEPCSNSFCNKGICYEPYNEDCTKYIQCLQDNNRVTRTVKVCPFAEYWNMVTLSCQNPKTVNCPYDPCDGKPDGHKYTTSGLGCRSFWSCSGGRSLGKCCQDGWTYDAIEECVKIPCADPACTQ